MSSCDMTLYRDMWQAMANSTLTPMTSSTCTYSGTDLACVAGIYQNVSGSKVTVDKGLIGEVVHSRGNLTTELEQEGWKITGHHLAWPVGRTKGREGQ